MRKLIFLFLLLSTFASAQSIKDSIKTVVVLPIAERQDTVKVRALLDEPVFQVRTYYLITRKYVFARETHQPDQPVEMWLQDVINPKRKFTDLQHLVIWMVQVK